MGFALPLTTNTKKKIRLGFAGDLMLGGETLPYARERGLALTYPFKDLVPTLRGLDMLLVNLEGPLFEDHAARLPRPFILSNHPAVVDVLKLPRVCVCTLANNHSMDYGADALFKTRKFLDRQGIRHLGAGRTSAEAERELIVEHSGWRIGCLAFTATGPSLVPIIANARHAGCASLENKSALLERVRRLKKRVDLAIVMLHWGREFYEYPSPSQVRLAHELIDAGADLIAGHHPHAIQPVEHYNGCVIAYSLGHLFMPPFRLSLDPKVGPAYPGARRNSRPATLDALGQTRPGIHGDGPVFYPRPASKEFMLLRVELPSRFPNTPGLVDTVAGVLDGHFRLRPYNRIALQTFRSRLDDLAYPLSNGAYQKFWRHYRKWRQHQLSTLLQSPLNVATNTTRH